MSLLENKGAPVSRGLELIILGQTGSQKGIWGMWLLSLSIIFYVANIPYYVKNLQFVNISAILCVKP